MGKAVDELKKEHSAIMHVLSILEKITTLQHNDFQYHKEIIYFLKVFADKCHHGKEENLLFKAMEAAGVAREHGPIGVMLFEHDLGRDLIKNMEVGIDNNDYEKFNENALQYINLLRNHIFKENNILFMMADMHLDEKTQDELYRKFVEFENREIGSGVHESLHKMIDKWNSVFDMG